ncbi:MAG: DUF951 domain-containing protein [Clostridium sp.]|nr:DUF951 domain-containing protein [Clostridium sp.]
MMKEFELDDIVETKKTHPCGSNKWKIIRVGADIKIQCVGCNRIVMIPRSKFENSIKKVIKENNN